MTNEEIISGLKFTIEMFLTDPDSGKTIKEPRNDLDKITIDACKGAIELLTIGHWQNDEWCSECGYELPDLMIDWKSQKANIKYCPKCGAIMKEEENKCL